MTEGNAISNGDFIGTTNNTDFVVKTNNNAVMHVTTGGNVGIGTGNPIRALHIKTEHHLATPPCPSCFPGIHNGMRLEDLTEINNVTTLTAWDIAPAGSKLIFSKADLNNPSAIDSKLTILDNGGVGIGTDAPLSTLDVRGTIINGSAEFKLGLFDGRNQGVKTKNRALVHDGLPVSLDDIIINYEGDFEDGVHIMGPSVSIDGNVGIGTPAPNAKLQVAKDFTGIPNQQTVTFSMTDAGINDDVSFLTKGSSGGQGDIALIDAKANNSSVFKVLGNGNVGIGTTAPQHKLHVFGNGKFENGSGSGVNIGFNSVNSFLYSEGTGALMINFHTNKDVVIGQTQASNLNINSTTAFSGKVSIGVPANKLVGNYRLYVADGILTEHCRVALQTSADWGDWVFDRNNKRMTFEEQWDYYMKYKHLKWIPSKDEVKKNGFDVSEVVTGIVINLEETRLDVLDIYKENVALKKQNDKQQKQIKLPPTNVGGFNNVSKC